MASWFSSLNPTPAFPDYTGPYQVGTLDVEIPVADLQSGDVLTPPPAAEEISTIAFRVFYPCQPPATPARPVRWVQSPQRATIGAFARFLGANNRMADVLSYFPQLLTYITIPAHRGAALHAPVQDTPRWPVMVFSHGLGGSRNTYSHYCGSLASHGMIVLAPEHRDGSGPVSYIRAVDAHPARSVDYRRISHAPSAEVYQGRDEQLSVRLWELGLLHKALLGVDAGTQLRNLDTHNSLKPSPTTADPADGLAMFRGRLDVHRPGAIAFAGHSFGACTSAQFVKSVFYSDTISTRILSYRPSAALTSQITPQTPLTLLDMWAMPFSSPATRALAAKPLPCFADPATGPGGAAVLSILSAAFFAWRDNCAGVKRILRDPSAPNSSRPAALLFYPLHSAHLSQSDFAILFPNITKYLARAQEPERTLRLNVRATLEVLRRAGASVAPTSAADVLDGAPAPAPAPTSAHSGPLAGDWQILSTQADAVRGWVAIPANEADEAGAAEEAARAAHRERPRPMRTLSSAAEGATSGGKLGGETHKPMDEAFGDSELSAAA